MTAKRPPPTQYLYVCLFDTMHIKVGRSLQPQQRIAQHADRVACLGIKMTDSLIVECVGGVIAAEAALIARCVAAATGRLKSEWFAGLQFEVVCAWAQAEAAVDYPAHPDGRTRDEIAEDNNDYLRRIFPFPDMKWQRARQLAAVMQSMFIVTEHELPELSSIEGWGVSEFECAAALEVYECEHPAGVAVMMLESAEVTEDAETARAFVTAFVRRSFGKAKGRLAREEAKTAAGEAS